LDRKLIDKQQSGHTDIYIFLKVIGSALYNEDAVLTKEHSSLKFSLRSTGSNLKFFFNRNLRGIEELSAFQV